MNPYLLGESTYSSLDTLPSAEESLPKRYDFHEATWARPSTMFRSAVQSIDAAITLLAFYQLGQAFILLMQAAEISLKAVIDEVAEMGTRTWAAHNPILVRNLAKSGQEFDESRLRENLMEKTFIGAFREANAYVSFSNQVTSLYEAANTSRNKIAHRGGEREHANLYLGQLLDGILPLLDEFYTKVVGKPICDLIGHHVARELIVANRYLRRHGRVRDAWAVALKPVAAAYFSNKLIEHGAPIDFDPHGYGWNDRSDLNYEWEKKVASSLVGNVLEEPYTSCRICHERCFLATDGRLRVRHGNPYFEISSMACSYCHLKVSEENSDLARLHYGQIDEQLLGHAEWVKLIRSFGLDPNNFQES